MSQNNYLSFLIKQSKQKVLLPFYHMVTDTAPAFVKHVYQPKNVSSFKDDLDSLCRYFHPISLEELIDIQLNQKVISKPIFHLTFDDGLQNLYKVIVPILLEKKIPATIFLNTDFVGNKNLFYRYKASLLVERYITASANIQHLFHQTISSKKIIDYLLSISYAEKQILDEIAPKVDISFASFLTETKPYLSLEQVKELQHQGFTFGVHSADHPPYQSLSIQDQIYQTHKGLLWLQENIQSKYAVFSFPFDDIGISKSFFDKIKNEVHLTFGTSGLNIDSIPFNLQRLDMEKSKTSIESFLIKKYRNFSLKKLLGQHIIQR